MRSLRHFFSHWQNGLGLSLVLIFIFVAIAAPLLSPNDPKNPGPILRVGNPLDYRPHSPAETPPLGTMSAQVDVFHALIWGTRSAVEFGLTVALLTGILGMLIGAISAYFGGAVNGILMRITDAFLSFPVIAGIVLFTQLLTITKYNLGLRFMMGGAGTQIFYPTAADAFNQQLPPLLIFLNQIDPVLIAFIVFSWMSYARIMNTVVMQVKHADYIEASRALGAGHTRMIFRHVIPNSITPLVVLAAKDVGGMVLLQATFTFIGLGNDSPWGLILVRGRDWIVTPGGILTFWWVFLPATLALILFGIGWNLLGDGLNDSLNPHTR